MCATLLAPAVHAQGKTVLTIYGGQSRTPSHESFGHNFTAMLGPEHAEGLQYHEEFLDSARFSGPDHERAFAEYLRARYAQKQVDLLVVVEGNGLQFAARHRSQLFAGVPVAFVGVRASTLAKLTLPADFFGVPAELDPGPTIRMALALRPQARELVLVTGVADIDRGWDQAVRAVPLPAGIRLRSLSGLALEQIEQELASLGQESVVLTTTFRRDGAGRSFTSGRDVLERLHKVSTAPIFHMYETGVGRGAVGSYSTPLDALAGQAAAIARQRFDGTPVHAIQHPQRIPPVAAADWRELRRWGMDETLLPPGTLIKFREPGFWEEYRLHALAFLSLLVLESALVAGLLVHRRHRRRVEAQLEQNERTMQLAANAAQLVMWNWDLVRDEIWFSDAEHPLASVVPPTVGARGRLLATVHVEDRDLVQRALRRAMGGDGVYECEYRVVEGDGAPRWFAARGRVEYVDRAARWLRGVTLDITRRKEAELDAQLQRNELAHLSRVSMLGELSGSVAHELNQPLTAILSNAQAARMFLDKDAIDRAELREILDDIIADDKRAGEIIWGMRRMLRKEETALEVVPINDLVQEVLRLMRGDLMTRRVAVELTLMEDLPAVSGSRMQLHQVRLNLIHNASDSMADHPAGERVLGVRTERVASKVRVSVSDRGDGIPPASLAGIFAPFFTTKKDGLGLGLSVCSSIIAAHGGELRAMNNPGRGATFIFTLHCEARVPA